ncbi:unnamed protein product [Withania somnifera]
MLQVDGDYTYSEGYSNMTASVALMFQIGENASYRMEGYEEGPDTCMNKSCKGYVIDLMHFSIGFGHLVDLYCWNPHCSYLDDYGPSGFAKDDSPYSSSNQSGAYYFEFSRLLRTMDRLKQFPIGKTSKMSVVWSVFN